MLFRSVADTDLLDAMANLAFDSGLDPAFRALALRLPGEDDMAATLHAAGHMPDPMIIYTARRALQLVLAQRLAPGLAGLEAQMRVTGAYSPDAVAAGKRALRLLALSLLSRLDGGLAARAAYGAADNMTECFGALIALLDIGEGHAEQIGRAHV